MNAATREPQVIDLLVTADQRRVQAETPRPVGLERLRFEKRRVSIGDVERFHGWMATGQAVDRDADLAELIDELRRGKEEA